MQDRDVQHFADPLDRATHEQQIALDEALRVAREKSKQAPPLRFTGHCHNCDEVVSSGLRFCDEDCRDDYQHRTDRRQVNRGTVH